MKKIVCLVANLALAGTLFANTETEQKSNILGPEPALNTNEINRWIVFYTNIHRVRFGRRPLYNEPDLGKAAHWQSRYCVKLGSLSHYATGDMYRLSYRAKHFGWKDGNLGENLSVKFHGAVDNVPFYIEDTEQRRYVRPVWWRDNEELARSILISWMNSSGHRRNMLNTRFTVMGAGSVAGSYSGLSAVYAAQVFGYTRETPLDSFKLIISESGDIKMYRIEYAGPLKPVIIRVVNPWVNDKHYNPPGMPEVMQASPFRKDYRDFLDQGPDPEHAVLYAGLKDPETGYIYPIKQLK